MREAPSIFTANNFSDYLTNYIDYRKSIRSSFSVRSFSRQIGLKSPSQMTMILRKERKPTLDFAAKLASAIELNRYEIEFMEKLIRLERADSAVEKNHLQRELIRLRPNEISAEFEAEVLSRWYTVVILEMTRLPSFKESAPWIKEKIGSLVTEPMINTALSVLKKHNAVQSDSQGVARKKAAIVKSTVKTPRSVIRAFHKQILTRAHSAINSQSIEERFVTSLTFAIPLSKTVEAAKLITKFRDEFLTAMAPDKDQTPEEVYHLGIQFFRATEKSIGIVKSDDHQ